jgi:hypothetical protein
MSTYLRLGVLAGLLFTLILSSAAAWAQSPFCADAGCEATRQTFKELCDFTVAQKAMGPARVMDGVPMTAIFITGYYMRALVGGYEIFGDQRYLHTAITYADTLLKLQNPQGYWLTGYGGIELADTGSAVGLFAVLYKHVDKDRQGKYVAAIQRYVDEIEKDKLILPSGALGYGWATNCNKKNDPAHCWFTGPPLSEAMTVIRPGTEITASSLTGGEVFTWLYQMTKNDKYRRLAYNSQRWVLSVMRKDGVIPDVDPEDGIFLEKQGDPENDFLLWDSAPDHNSTYTGEGLMSFDLHCDQLEWQAELRGKIKPHIEWVLRTQNANGSWGHPDPRSKSACNTFDQSRSPGIANLLIWYYEHVDKDPRVLEAVRKFDRFLLNKEDSKAFGILSAGAFNPSSCWDGDAATALAGYALTDILVPGLSSNWETEAHGEP